MRFGHGWDALVSAAVEAVDDDCLAWILARRPPTLAHLDVSRNMRLSERSLELPL